MVKPNENTFIHLIDKTTMEEIYQIQFDYGVRTIQVKEGTKITLDYVHGGFEESFSRVGNDLIIGDDLYVAVMQPLGVGYGKELWFVTENNDSTYTIDVNKYQWAGCSYGYADTPKSTETITMTADELAEFQTEHGVTVQVGMNTLYTTWPVLPNPNIYYHMEDRGFYAPANGKIILKDYFKYGKDTIFVGDRLLSDIIQNNKKYADLLTVNAKKSYKIYDTFFDENLYGGDRADKIYSMLGDDTIEGGKGNDKIYLGEGDKTIVVSQGDGKDAVYNFEKADSVNFKVDTDNVYFIKSKNDLILNRNYFDGTEKTVIKNYFKNSNKDHKIIVSKDDEILVSDFTQELADGTAYLRAKGNKVIKGTDFNDEAYSSVKNETFKLGKGHDIIHFQSDGLLGFSPYNFGKDTVKIEKGTHLTLDFSDTGANLSFERRGNDVVITGRHHIELCGRSTGKEEWLVIKNGSGSYTVTKQSYYFNGNGFSAQGSATTETMTADELQTFREEHGVTVKVGKNTLYTSWAVVPNPVIHYSMTDSSNWGTLLGEVVLKDYFKYKEDSVYIGNKSLQEYFKDEEFVIDNSKSKKAVVIRDTGYRDIIKGGNGNDRIFSLGGNDLIDAGKGDDRITLGAGDKTVNIHNGGGEDTLIITENNSSVSIVFDDNVEGVSFEKSGSNLVITRMADDKIEKTIIKKYYSDDLSGKISVSVGDEIIWSGKSNPNGLIWTVMCNYPPAEPATPSGQWELVCAYPSDDTDVLNLVGQNLTAWQTTCPDDYNYICQDVSENIDTTLVFNN